MGFWLKAYYYFITMIHFRLLFFTLNTTMTFCVSYICETISYICVRLVIQHAGSASGCLLWMRRPAASSCSWNASKPRHFLCFLWLLCFWLCNMWGLPHFVWLLTTTQTYLYSIVCCLLFIVLYKNCACVLFFVQWTTNYQFYYVSLSWIVLQCPIKDQTDLHWHCFWPLGVRMEHDKTPELFNTCKLNPDVDSWSTKLKHIRWNFFVFVCCMFFQTHSLH